MHIIKKVSFCEKVESTVISTSSTVYDTERHISPEDLNNLYEVHDNERRVKRLVSDNKSGLDNLYITKSLWSKGVDSVVSDGMSDHDNLLY